MSERKQLTEKFREAVASVLPITLIVTIVCFSFVPVTTDLMLSVADIDGQLPAGRGHHGG